MGPDAEWHYLENEDRGGSWSELAPAALSSRPAAPRSGPHEAHEATGRLAALAASWATDGFHGRARQADRGVGISADSYSDSLVLSGPRALAEALSESGLEVFSLPRGVSSPMTSE